MKKPVQTLLVIFSLTCSALLPESQAVNPPLTPDPGPKPVSNTADGQNALLSITTGIHNTAIGFDSLLSNSDANFNTAVGSVALLLNNAPENTATGAGALLSNITGTDNTANGAFALFSNIATGNTAIGARALLNNTTGGTLENVQGIDLGPNVAVGWQALESNTVASANTAVGYQALQSFTSGPMGFEQVGACTAVGFQVLANTNSTTGGFANSGFGYQALFSNTDGAANTALGFRTLFTNATGTGNTAVGSIALGVNTTGEDNTAIGVSALRDNMDGTLNTAVGENALADNVSGSSNTAIGTFALQNSSGSNNIAVGDGAGFNVATADNVICIGAIGEDIPDSCFIGNIVGSTVANSNSVLIDTATGQLGTNPSSERFKKDIGPMGKTSEAIFWLKPVTFHYKDDKTSSLQFGLVAEEVAKVNPALITLDKEGKPYSVRYDKVDAMLLNEFLKEHKKMEEQQATIAQLKQDFQSKFAEQQKKIEALTKGLERVSAQLEADRSVPQVVVTNQ